MSYYMQVVAFQKAEWADGDPECYCLDYQMGIMEDMREYYCTPTTYYCYEYFYICWTELYDSEGFCLDFCEYGYDYETLECYTEEVWNMFTETPFKCVDPFFCSITPPGSDTYTWLPYVDDEDNTPEFKIGFFEVSTDSAAPCLPWDRYIEDFNMIKVYDGQDYDLINLDQNVSY